MLAAKVLFVEVAAYRYLLPSHIERGSPHAVLIIIFSMTRIEEASDQRPGADIGDRRPLDRLLIRIRPAESSVSPVFSSSAQENLRVYWAPTAPESRLLMRTLPPFSPPWPGV